MKRKLLTLLTLLLCAVGGAWGDTETVYSWISTGNSENVTETGGTASGKFTTVTNYCMQLADKYSALKTNNHIIITLSNSATFKEGDVITVKGYYSKGENKSVSLAIIPDALEGNTDGIDHTNTTGLILCTDTDWPDVKNTTFSTKEHSYTLTSAYNGKTAITLTRNSSATSLNLASVVITRTVADSYAPTITTQPTSASYMQNATATALSVVATASSGNLSYQWYSNTTNSTTGATAISEATSATYTPSTATIGTTYYYCAVTDDNGTINSSIAAITVTSNTVATTYTVGYTEAISGTTLAARSLTSADTNVTINTTPIFGSAITDQGSKTVYIDNTEYTNNKSWRKSVSGSYDNQYVGYTLTVAQGYKMNIKNVNARIAVADDTYTWYVEILNSGGNQVWSSSERTTTKAESGKINNVDVSDKPNIQGLTGTVTVKLWVKQGGSTKYFSINYLQLEVNTEVDNRTTYAMAVSSANETMGTVSPADGSNVTEGESVTFTATPASDEYKFVKWTIDGTDYTTNPYTLENVTASHTAVATFAKRYKVTYNISDYLGTYNTKQLCNVNRSNGIDEVYSTDADKYIIPAYAHKYLYREGYVFDKWQDADANTYASGAEITMTKDITLTPTWKEITQSLSTSAAETTVTWSFAKSDIVFVDWQSSNYGYYTQTVSVNNESIAIPMKIANGKVANYTRTDAIAQTNQNTTFTIPAVSGMTVTIAEAYTAFSTTTIAGSTEYTKSSDNKTITYTYEGNNPTIDIVIGENGQYLKTIAVTYPVGLPASDLTITSGAAINKDLDDTTADKTHQITYTTSGTGAVTFSSSNSKVASVSASGLVTALSNGTATITVSQEADASHAAGEATMTITVTGGITILGTDEIELVYTNNGYNSNTLTWTDGTYSLVAATGGISGNDGQCFKLQNRTYTLKVPSNIRVDRIEYTGYDYNSNYSDNEGAISTSTITVDGTTAMTGWKAYYANYNSAVNTTIAEDIEHTTGNDITLVVTNTGQLIGTLKLYVSEIQPTDPPTLSSTSHTTTHNGSVTLNFSVDMQEATGTIDGQSITAEGGSSALVFHYWGLDYSKEVTFTVPASSLRDKYGNAYAGEDITITFNTEAKPVLTKKKFDVIVGTEGNEDLQEVLNRYKNYSNSERAYIFIPDGTYKLTGNSSITTSQAQTGYVYNESTNQTGSATNYPAGTYTDNAMTQLKASNLSIIGQSTEGTILYNIPYIPGISYTSTLEFKSGSNDNYIQDFTLKNMYAGGANDKGVAVAFYDRGTRTIAKDISCWSNQDTYVSNGARDYYETCTFAGTVDFICGNGDVWFQECNLIINDRSGNVITAPRTAATEKWGYVFYRNTISLAQGATAAQNGNWYLGRPWNNSPAATYLYTKMNTTPKAAGWTNMTNNCTLRFHEYGSTDGNGSALSLSNRSISACNGNSDSDNPVLTADQAAKYTIHNVVGGNDGWDPTEFTAQVSVTGLAVSGNTLSWDNNDDALCWMVFKDGVYYDNVITNSITLSGAGIYSVRAANARGGLGEASEIATVSTLAGRNYGTCVTGCGLDFTNVTDAKAYIATGLNSAKTAVVLQQVNKVAANTPLIIYTEEKDAAATVRVPITTDDPDAAVESNLLVAGDGTTQWNGTAGYTYYYIASDQFHKATSGTLQSGKAYLKIDNVNSGARLGFVFADEATSVSNVNRETITNNRYYDLQGRRIDGSRLNPGVYIKDGRKVVVK